jgi:hypothetical protein
MELTFIDSLHAVGYVPSATRRNPPPNEVPIPGAMSDITGNHGGSFAVQSLWSNQAAAGAGYCPGTADELP